MIVSALGNSLPADVYVVSGSVAACRDTSCSFRNRVLQDAIAMCSLRTVQERHGHKQEPGPLLFVLRPAGSSP